MTYQTVRQVYSAADLPFTQCDSLDFVSGDYDREIAKRIVKVIREEAPITEWLLIKRVINSFGIYKAGSKIKAHMEKLLMNMRLNDTRDKTGTVYWKEKQKPSSYNVYRVFGAYDETVRDVQYVPDAEIANAAASVLEEENLTYEDLARKTAFLLGYTRMGTNVTAGMKRGIECAVKMKKIRQQSCEYEN